MNPMMNKEYEACSDWRKEGCSTRSKRYDFSCRCSSCITNANRNKRRCEECSNKSSSSSCKSKQKFSFAHGMLILFLAFLPGATFFPCRRCSSPHNIAINSGIILAAATTTTLAPEPATTTTTTTPRIIEYYVAETTKNGSYFSNINTGYYKSGWKPQFKFQVYAEPVPGTQTLCRLKPHIYKDYFLFGSSLCSQFCIPDYTFYGYINGGNGLQLITIVRAGTHMYAILGPSPRSDWFTEVIFYAYVTPGPRVMQIYVAETKIRGKMHSKLRTDNYKRGWTPMLRFEVYADPFSGSEVYCVGKDKYSEYVMQGRDCNVHGFVHAFKFYALQYGEDTFQLLTVSHGTSPYRVAVDMGRSERNITNWIGDYELYSSNASTNTNVIVPTLNANATMSIYVAEKVIGGKLCTSIRPDGYDSNSLPKLRFEGYVEPFSGAQVYCVAKVKGSDYIIPTADCDVFQWNHSFIFYTKAKKGDDLQLLTVSYLPDPYRISVDSASSPRENWLSAYAIYSSDVSVVSDSTEIIYVSANSIGGKLYASLSTDGYKNGWEKKLSFEAYAAPFPGAQVYCVATLANRDYIMQTRYCGVLGWKHKFTFYILQNEAKGLQLLTVSFYAEPDRMTVDLGSSTSKDSIREWEIYSSNVFVIPPTTKTTTTIGGPPKMTLYISEKLVNGALCTKINTDGYSSDFLPKLQLEAFTKDIGLETKRLCIDKTNDDCDIVKNHLFCSQGKFPVYVYIDPTDGYELMAVQRSSSSFQTYFQIGGEQRRNYIISELFYAKYSLYVPPDPTTTTTTTPPSAVVIYVAEKVIKGTLRMDIGTHGYKNDWKPRLQFEAYTKPLPGTQMYYVGKNRDGDYMIAKDHAGGISEWKHDLLFYAYENKRQGHELITFSHFRDPYRVIVDLGASTRNDFLTAYELYTPKVSVVSATYIIIYVAEKIIDGKLCAKVTLDDYKKDWKHKLEFEAYAEPFPGAQIYCVATSDDRDYIMHRDDCFIDGWDHGFAFYISPNEGKGLQLLTLSRSEDSDRMTVDVESLTNKDWITYDIMYSSNVFVISPTSLFIYVAEKIIDGNRFTKVRPDGYESGWTPILNFEAYAQPVSGTQVYCVATLDDRDYIMQTRDCGVLGWNHTFKFYALQDEGYDRQLLTVSHRTDPYRVIVEFGSLSSSDWITDYEIYSTNVSTFNVGFNG